jgi:hypothetical protein
MPNLRWRNLGGHVVVVRKMKCSNELLFLLCWWSFVVRADEGLSVRKVESSL